MVGTQPAAQCVRRGVGCRLVVSGVREQGRGCGDLLENGCGVKAAFAARVVEQPATATTEIEAMVEEDARGTRMHDREFGEGNWGVFHIRYMGTIRAASSCL